MDTQKFLEAVLPPDGWYYLVIMQAGSMAIPHYGFNNIPALAKAIAQTDGKPQLTAYFGCSAYKNKQIKKEGKDRYRIQENQLSAKAFWIDIDCGEEKAAAGKGYATKLDGSKAILAFCHKTSFPKPLIVDSGNGLHCYWVLDHALEPTEWKRLADRLKEILAHFKVIADPSRTSDFASILRPVGSHHKKDPANWKQVKAKTPLTVYRVEEIIAAMSNIVSNFDVVCKEVSTMDWEDRAPIQQGIASAVYSDVKGSAVEIAKHCSQVRSVMETGGVDGYEQWRGTIGIIKFCENPNETAHAWSAKSISYTEFETQQKLDTWDGKPTTCAHFERHFAAGCVGCVHKGKINSPISLGKVIAEPEPAKVVEVVTDSGEKKEVVIPELVGGFEYIADTTNNGHMYRHLKNKDGVVESFRFASVLFYPVTRINQQHGLGALVRIRRHLPNGKIREFDIEQSTVAVGGTTLLSALGDNEIMPTDNKDANTHITAYLRTGINSLIKQHTEITTYNSFGWNEEKTEFLLGSNLYKQDGSVERVRLSAQAQSRVVPFTSEGSSQGWSDAIHTLYDHPDMELYKYTLAAGFGSVLVPFTAHEYHGIMLVLSGEESGMGKTTVCNALLSAYGDAEMMTSNGADGITQNARGGRMGTYRNIPTLFDELTNIKVAALSETAYTISTGLDKVRSVSGKDGVVAAEVNSWNMHSFATSNRNLGMHLTTGRANSQAEAVRLLEFDMDSIDKPTTEKSIVVAAVNQLHKNRGTAAPEFIKFVIANPDVVRDKINHYMGVVSKMGTVIQNNEFRFYRYHAITTLAAADIINLIGLVRIDMVALEAWAQKRLLGNCLNLMQNNVVDGEDALTMMINDMYGEIIVTQECRDGRGNTMPEQVPRMSKPPVGRAILGNAAGTESKHGRLYVEKKAVRNWCDANRVNKKKLFEYVEKNDFIIDLSDDKFVLGVGTNVVTAQVRCYCFDLNKINNTSAPKLTLVKTEEV